MGKLTIDVFGRYYKLSCHVLIVVATDSRCAEYVNASEYVHDQSAGITAETALTYPDCWTHYCTDTTNAFVPTTTVSHL